jgi:hypothetical protein
LKWKRAVIAAPPEVAMSDRPDKYMNSPSMGGRFDTPGSTAPGARPGTEDVSDTVKRAAGKAADEVKAEGAELLDQAKGRAEGLVEEGKAAGAEHASGFARAIHHAADDLEESSPDIARHVRAAGDSIRGIADAMRDRSAGQLLEDVNDFARRQPTLFFGAAAIAGFALVRFAKSSAEGRPGTPSRLKGSTTSTSATGVHARETPPPASMARATLGGAAAHGPSGSSAGRPLSSSPSSTPPSPPSPGLATPAVRSGSVPNEKSDSPL